MLAAVMTRDLGAVISQQSFPTLAWTYLFGAMRGFIFKEWKGAGPRARQLILTGIATLVVSTIIIGVGTWIKGQGGGH